jgi:hypothetical protein
LSIPGPGSSCAWAASLLWLAACAASGPGDVASAGSGGRIFARWTEAPPERCAVGSSGPTLNPRSAIRNARLSAIEALAADSLAVDVQSISGEGPDGSFEIAAQALSGTLEDARVVAIWADVDSGQGASPRIRQVYSLACWPDASLAALPDPDYPSWLLDPPPSSGRICASGIAGPTWKPGDQQASALRDARLALAVALESRIEKRIFDDGHGVAKIARQVEPSAAARARAAGAEELDREWFDEAGTGPIGLPGVLYGLACIED